MKQESVAPYVSRRHALTARAAAALPPVSEILVGGLLWGAGMSASAYVALGRINDRIDGHLPAILLLFFLGGAAALPLAAFAARLLVTGVGWTVKLLACFALLAVSTVGMTAALFAMDNARFYVGWTDLIAGPFTLFEISITIIVAIAAFIVLGVRLFLPVGLAVLVVGSLWLAARIR